MMPESFDIYALMQHRRTTAAAATTGNQNGERKKPNLSFRCRQETQEEERLVQYLQRWQSMAGGRSADDAEGERRAMRRGDENTGRKKEGTKTVVVPPVAVPPAVPPFTPRFSVVVLYPVVKFCLSFSTSFCPRVQAYRHLVPLALLYSCRHSPWPSLGQLRVLFGGEISRLGDPKEKGRCELYKGFFGKNSPQSSSVCVF